MKKWEFQIIVFMITLTRSSERIYNPMRYTGIFWYSGLECIYLASILILVLLFLYNINTNLVYLWRHAHCTCKNELTFLQNSRNMIIDYVNEFSFDSKTYGKFNGDYNFLSILNEAEIYFSEVCQFTRITITCSFRTDF